jgi:hypothetical protein
VTVNFEDTKQSFVSASQTPSNITINSITFNISNLPILGSEIITNTVSTEIVDNLSTTGFVQAENIKLSPNPADDRVEIINASNAEIQNIYLYSINGLLVRNFERFDTLDISPLPSGVYLLKIETDSSKSTKRLIKM